MKQLNLLKQLLLPVLLALGLCQPAGAQTITSGTYTVGPGGYFANLADAISDLNGSTISGPVVFNILPGSYSGSSWQVQLNGITGSSASNTVTFQAQSGPGTVDITVTGTSTDNYVFKLNDVSNVIVKNLTLINNSSTGYGIVYKLTGASSNDLLTGCTLTGVSTTSTSDNLAVVHLGYGASSISGGSNVISNNTIQNGSMGVTLSGASATAFTADDVIANNSISGSSTYGIAVALASNPAVTSNTISGTATTYNAGIYLNNNGNGMNVLSNIVNVNTTTAGSSIPIYGIFNQYTNNTTQTTGATTQVNNNNVTVAVTTGYSFPLFNNYCYNLTMTGNTFTGTSTTGSIMPPQLMWNCTNSYATGNTFNSTASSSGSIANNTWNFMSYAANCTVRLNTFNLTTTSGSIFAGNFNFLDHMTSSVCNKNTWNINSTSGGQFTSSNALWFSRTNTGNLDSNVFNITSTSGVIGNTYSGIGDAGFDNYCSGTISMSNNKFNITSSNTGTSYGFWGYYPTYYQGAGSTILVVADTFNITFNNPNTFYLFGYYYSLGTPSTSTGSIVKLNNCVWNVNLPNGTSTFVALNYYYMFYYCQAGSECINNNMTINTTYGTIMATPYYWGYNSTQMKIKNNSFKVNATSSATVYNPATISYYGNSIEIADNNFITNAANGTTYMGYYAIYGGSGIAVRNNTFTCNATSGGNIYPFYFYTGYNCTADTIENNTVNATTTSGYIYLFYYYIATSLCRNNTFNLTTTSGWIYNGNYYPYGGKFYNNKFKFTSTSGWIYGINEPYTGASTSYTSPIWINNTFDLRSTSGGNIYGYYSSTQAKDTKLIGNLFSTSTSGSSYLFYNTSGSLTDLLVANNTFHSNSTGTSSNTLFYNAGSYAGKTLAYNNIFSRSTGGSTSNPVYISDTTHYIGDYNLVYSPGTFTMQCGSPSLSATTLQAWRSTTKRDMNSLSYDPGYLNPAAFDFHPDPANPNSWAVNGRGTHIPGDTTDVTGAPRPKTRPDGVPDLGAYEFTPTSTPPDAIATPATPAAGTTQVFTFGGDTVASVQWGVSAPTSVSVKQYSGEKASVVPTNTPRMFFSTAINTATGVYDYKPLINYKDPWLGDVSNETNLKIAKSSNGGTWQGYNYTNGVTDSVKNILAPLNNFDSLSSAFTGVENARIGVRCFFSGPTGLTFSLIGADSAIASWEAVFAPLGYEIVFDQSQFDPVPPYSNYNFSAGPLGNSVPLLGLTEDTKYYVHVRTICQLGDTSVWTTGTFSTLVRCHAPNVGATSITDTRAVVYWDTVKTGFQYEYVIDQNQADPPFGTMTVNRSIQATGLQPATDYYAHVRSFCNNIYNTSVKPDGSPLWTTYKFTTLFPESVSNSAGAKSGMSTYPNPAKDKLTIQLFDKIDGTATLSITDVTGKVLRNIEVTGMKMEVNVATLPSGMYLLKYTDRSRTEITKLNKE